MPAGFRAGGLAAGIKPSGRPDLGVVATLGGPAAVAAVFTRTSSRPPGPPLAGAPQRHGARRRRPVRLGGRGRLDAGCANAATGPGGDADQAEVCRLVAEASGTRPTDTSCRSRRA